MSNPDNFDPISVELNIEELLLINNALNEVCNGIDLDDPEFSIRLGYSRDKALALLGRIGGLLSA